LVFLSITPWFGKLTMTSNFIKRERTVAVGGRPLYYLDELVILSLPKDCAL